jgi:hypothetical protein
MHLDRQQRHVVVGLATRTRCLGRLLTEHKLVRVALRRRLDLRRLHFALLVDGALRGVRRRQCSSARRRRNVGVPRRRTARALTFARLGVGVGGERRATIEHFDVGAHHRCARRRARRRQDDVVCRLTAAVLGAHQKRAPVRERATQRSCRADDRGSVKLGQIDNATRWQHKALAGEHGRDGGSIAHIRVERLAMLGVALAASLQIGAHVASARWHTGIAPLAMSRRAHGATGQRRRRERIEAIGVSALARAPTAGDKWHLRRQILVQSRQRRRYNGRRHNNGGHSTHGCRWRHKAWCTRSAQIATAAAAAAAAMLNKQCSLDRQWL